MADYNASVALGINPPDPQGTLNSLNKIMNLGSTGLAIQGQKQGLVGQAAQVKQEQLKASQAQGVQDFFNSWDPTAHLSPDGTIDADSVHNNPAYKAAGNAKPLIDQQLLSIKQGQLQNKQALATLDDNLINRYATTMGTLANDKDVKEGGINGQAKVAETLRNFSKLQPEAARIAQMFGAVVKNAPIGSDGVTKPNLAHLVQSQQLMGADVLGQRSQQGTPTIIQTATGQQPGTTAPGVEGGGFTPEGKEISAPPSVVTGPNQQLLRVPRGATTATPIDVNQQVPPPPPPGKLQPLQRPNANAPAADQANYNAQIAQAGAEQRAVSNAAIDPQNGVQVSRYRNGQILDLTKIAPTGPGKDIWNHMASQFAGGSGDAFQKIGHYLAQQSAAMAGKMGVPNTNMGQETAAAAAGNVAQNPERSKKLPRSMML